jgi:hypothetical protein
MSLIEMNGFDESGSIGEPIKFVRFGLNREDELKPFIYNLLHFGTLNLTKAVLRERDIRTKRRFIRDIFSDTSFSINEYIMNPEFQLLILKMFMASEFNYVKIRRDELIRAYNSEKLKETVSEVISSLRKYLFPFRYIESCVKAYGHRYMVEDLIKTSKILRDPRNHGSCRVYSLIDGGYPFAFWYEGFQDEKFNIGMPFSRYQTPIFGISHGDEYFPTISLSGSIAYITKEDPSLSYSYRIKQIEEISDIKLEDFVLEYSKSCSNPFFLERVLFYGQIPKELQYVIPYINYIRNNRLTEPFRVTKSFTSFYKEFRGRSEKDLIIRGDTRPDTNDEILEEECIRYNLNVIEASDFVDPALSLLADINERAIESNLGSHPLSIIDRRLHRIESILNNYYQV